MYAKERREDDSIPKIHSQSGTDLGKVQVAKGRIVIDTERCKGCKLCQSACPQDVISLADSLNNKGYRSATLLDPEHKCTGCALCAVVCPDDCITVYRVIHPRVERHEKEARYHVGATA